MAKKHLIGKGTFGWLAEERIYGKYGSVLLEPNISLNKVRRLNGLRGRLEVVIAENDDRESLLYDPITGRRPSLPKVGDCFVLGNGEFYSFSKYRITSVGLDSGRKDTPVLDVEALYKAFNQVVELYFVEEEDETN